LGQDSQSKRSLQAPLKESFEASSPQSACESNMAASSCRASSQPDHRSFVATATKQERES
jgi:hypothetical protein